LKKAGFDPALRRSDPTWPQFLKAQAAGILTCDFFSVETVMLARLYCFAAVDHATRRVHVLGVTANHLLAQQLHLRGRVALVAAAELHVDRLANAQRVHDHHRAQGRSRPRRTLAAASSTVTTARRRVRSSSAARTGAASAGCAPTSRLSATTSDGGQLSGSRMAQQYESNPTADDHHGANPSRRDYASRPDRVAHPVVGQL
jgi:hypothetical protein